MLNGIERAAQHGYFVVIASLPALDRRSMLDTVDRFLGHAVEGIIVIAPQTSAVAALGHVPADLPLVAVGCGTRAPLTSIAVDNAGGAAQATRYLLSLGHETVHHVAGPGTWLDSRERIDGWRAALNEAGAREPEVISGDWSARSGYEIGQKLAAKQDVTAVFCANDTLALGLIRALTERGRRVPDDISVVGFDDVPEAGYFLPPLTTVRQDFGEVGRLALSALVDRIASGPGPGVHLAVPPELVVRASAAPPGGPSRPGYARGMPGHHPLVPAFDGAAVPLGEVLDRQVELLREAHHAGQPVAAKLLRGTGTAPPGPGLTLETARLAVARDHGYPDWAAAREQAEIMRPTWSSSP